MGGDGTKMSVGFFPLYLEEEVRHMWCSSVKDVSPEKEPSRRHQRAQAGGVLCTVNWAWAWLTASIQAGLNQINVQVEFYRALVEGSFRAELESLGICFEFIYFRFVR